MIESVELWPFIAGLALGGLCGVSLTMCAIGLLVAMLRGRKESNLVRAMRLAAEQERSTKGQLDKAKD